MSRLLSVALPPGQPGSRQGRWLAVAGLAGITAYVAVIARGMGRWPYDFWGAMVIAPCLLLISWPLLAAAFRREEDGWVRRLIGVAFTCKLAVSLVSWFLAVAVYRRVADATRYDREGQAVAAQIRDGIFSIELSESLVGTGFVILLTGVVYVLIGPSVLGGYLVFSWFGFWGLYLFYRAFRIAMPGANHRRYAVLIFLLPSTLLWTSAIGKEAWMILCLGLAALGAARLLTGTRGAALPLALGLAGSLMVRPHETAFVVIAIIAGFVYRRDLHRTAISPLMRTFTLAALAAAGVLIALLAVDFLEEGDLDTESVGSALADNRDRAVGGDSEFAAQLIQSPADVPRALVTVLFRPFPWEAGNLPALATSAESVLLFLLMLASLSRVRAALTFRPWRPYVVMSLAYIAMHVYALSSIGNFGLLARQRVLIFPLLLVLLCSPTMRDLRRRRAAVTRESLGGEVLIR